MKKRFIITTFLMLLFVTVALSTGTYAWFTMSYENQLTEFQIEARAASGGLEISLNGSTFNDTSVSMTSPSLKALDVTSPDGVQMFKATSVSSKNGKPTAYDYAEANTDYYQFDLYFRTSSRGFICIDGANNGCAMVPVGSTLDGASADNKSASGDFSRDYIVGAARISFQVTGYQNSSTNIWDGTVAKTVVNSAKMVTPDNTYDSAKTLKVSDINLTQDSTTRTWSVGTMTKSENIYLPSDTPLFAEGAEIDNDYFDDTSSQVNGRTDLTEVQKSLTYTQNGKHYAGADIYDVPTGTLSTTTISQSGWPTTSNYALANIGSCLVGDFDNSNDYISTSGYVSDEYDDGKYQITKVTVRIWIEGQDNEAKSQLAQGKFKTNLSFKFIPATIEGTTKLAAPTIAKSGSTITWGQVVGAAKYEIFKVTSGDGSTESPYQFDDDFEYNTTNHDNYTNFLYAVNLPDGDYVVKAIHTDSSRSSDYSNKVTITTP